MTFVVTEACIRCKFMDCVEVCPVNCFHEGDNMLVINPEICIDCGVCELECPANAIIPDSAPGAETWVAFNQEHARKWPSILQPGIPPKDAQAWVGVPNKMKFLADQPAAPEAEEPGL